MTHHDKWHEALGKAIEYLNVHPDNRSPTFYQAQYNTFGNLWYDAIRRACTMKRQARTSKAMTHHDKEPEPMNTTDILAHASELASQEPNDWFKHFERYDADLMRWCRCQSQQQLFRFMALGRGIRLAPATMNLEVHDLPAQQMAAVSVGQYDLRKVHITLTYHDKAAASQALNALTDAFTRSEA